MADIKVRDLTDTSSIALDNQIMVLTNDAQNQVQNITVENLLSNVLSSDNGNVLEQGADGKLYVETPENITGYLADLDTVNKTSLVNSINEVVSNLSTEATTRQNADNNLQSQIDAITAASDVTDIVGTYAQLQAYDTTGLPDNSIIKVLQDESRQNETTYYRWVITGGVGAWVLIGEEGPYYTKSQADNLFATQQTTGNLASLDTSDKTSLVNAINELSSVLDPTQTADYINNSKAVESGAISSNSIILSDVIKYAHSSFDLSKFTVTGSPTITDDGILVYAHPSSAQGLIIPTNLIGKKPFVLKFRATRGTFTKGNWFLGNSNAYDIFSGWVHTSSLIKDLVVRVYNDDTSTASAFSFGEVKITEGKTFDTILSWDGSAYTLKMIDANDRTVYKDTTVKSSLPINTNIQRLIELNTFNTGMTYDLKQFSITVDGVEVFSGNKTGIDTIKPDDYSVVGTPTISADGVASGFSYSPTSNIATPNLSISAQQSLIIECAYFYKTSDMKGIYSFGSTRLLGTSLWTGTGTMILAFTNELNSLGLSEGDLLKTKLILTADTATVYLYANGREITKSAPSTISLNATTIYIGSSASNGYEPCSTSIDLNAFKIYVDGNLVYQPCLKIPYTKGSEQYGGKYVNAQYLPRVKDAYEQGLANDYFTLDEANGTYTLPMGNLYGMIEKLNQLAKDEIGLPKATLSNTLNDNEIWLEGAEVSKITYAKLYAIYGDDYGTPTDSANFVLPDFRDRVMQGIGSGGTFGYIKAGLPNIKGKQNEVRRDGDPNNNGALHSSHTRTGVSSGTGGGQAADIYFDASWSNSIYGNSTTVQPPAIKVRFKTRFQ